MAGHKRAKPNCHTAYIASDGLSRVVITLAIHLVELGRRDADEISPNVYRNFGCATAYPYASAGCTEFFLCRRLPYVDLLHRHWDNRGVFRVGGSVSDTCNETSA